MNWWFRFSYNIEPLSSPKSVIDMAKRGQGKPLGGQLCVQCACPFTASHAGANSGYHTVLAPAEYGSKTCFFSSSTSSSSSMSAAVCSISST